MAAPFLSRKFGVLCGAVVLAGMLAGSTALADNNWVPGSGLWDNPANWSQGHVPDTTAEVVAIINGGTAEYNSSMGSTSFGPAAGNNEFRVGSGPAGNTVNTLNVTGGALQKNNGEVIVGWGAGGPVTGIINVSGGTFTLNPAGVNPILTLGWLGATGNLNVSGTGSVNASVMRCGSGPNGTCNVSVTDGGTLTVPELLDGWDGGHGTVTQDGGTVVVTTKVQVGEIGGVGTYGLNGGLLRTPRIQSATNGTMKFNGGTLQATANGSYGNGMTMLVQNGGAIIDTNAFNGTVHSALLEDGSSPGGGLDKLGLGTLTLSTGNTYAGDTKVLAGTLSIGDAYLNDLSKVFLTTGATLDLNFSGMDTIRDLLIDNVPQAAGVWGAIGSGALNQSALLTGTGFLNVVVPEPSVLVLLAAAAPGLLTYVRRKRK